MCETTERLARVGRVEVEVGVGVRRGEEVGFRVDGEGEGERGLKVGDETGVDNDGAMRYELLVTESERKDEGGGASAEEECEYACCA